MSSENNNNIPYRFNDDTADAIDDIKSLTGLKTTTKATTKPSLNTPYYGYKSTITRG